MLVLLDTILESSKLCGQTRGRQMPLGSLYIAVLSIAAITNPPEQLRYSAVNIEMQGGGSPHLGSTNYFSV